ncbi:pyroglutamyl-peptidase 1 isoform X1 [Scyliorhinus canicula]|uniref:pyroglutamyl-peptidase 1 isoform X1 n=1 Tax=Scyliorhinus canicula TaxID=7830 RepID=UPI0018F6419A|nr:pyroglutamyl-peptidase 1 isoform X1 [Scyliorhinus canicula]XP_038640381.1 pyroglutamyl-peptidase 1 isoform X1 [Scyliorhinus canicula]
MDSSSQLVLLTGFGPFRQYVTNPSWTAVQKLKELGLGENVRLEALELPVHYCRTQELLAGMWETQQPQLAVHVGVATASKVIILEQLAKNNGYKDRDVSGVCPVGHCCVEGGPEKIESLINMRAICKKLSGTDIGIIYSRDAGRYLCDYAYYLSLHHGNRKAAFIHIPQLNDGITAEIIGKTLQLIVQEMLGQVETALHCERAVLVKVSGEGMANHRADTQLPHPHHIEDKTHQPHSLPLPAEHQNHL